MTVVIAPGWGIQLGEPAMGRLRREGVIASTAVIGGGGGALAIPDTNQQNLTKTHRRDEGRPGNALATCK